MQLILELNSLFPSPLYKIRDMSGFKYLVQLRRIEFDFYVDLFEYA